MGKATILQGGLHGLYIVRLDFDRSRIAGFVARIDQDIARMDAIIANPATPAQAVARARLQKAELLSRKHYLENSQKDIVCPAWCADLSETLTGAVGSIEVPGERTKGVNIHPGHIAADAAYEKDRDGQLRIPVAVSPEAAFYNLAILPGWQKYYPTYRYGTITALTIAAAEGGTDYCDVTLDEAISSQQNLNVNQTTTLSAVPIQYMDCGGAGFSVGDQILIGFDDQDWSKPFALGYKDHPKNCHSWIVYIVGLLDVTGNEYLNKKVALVWDPKLNRLVRAPVSIEDPEYVAWHNARYNVAAQDYLLFQGLCGRRATVSQYDLVPDGDGNYPMQSVPSGCPALSPTGLDWFEIIQYPNFVRSSAEIQAARVAFPFVYDWNGFPQSGYYHVVLPGTPIEYQGFRTYYKETNTGAGAEILCNFITPLGVEAFSGYYRTDDEYYYIDNDYGSGASFDYSLVGKYSTRELMQFCIMQYVASKQIYLGNNNWSYPERQERVVKAHAQALYQRSGFNGVNITEIGRNTELEAQLIAAVNLAYTLNGIAANALRKCVVTTAFKN